MKYDKPVLEYKEELERNIELVMGYKKTINDLVKELSKYEIGEVKKPLFDVESLKKKEEQLIKEMNSHAKKLDTENSELEKCQNFCICLFEKVQKVQEEINKTNFEINQKQCEYIELQDVLNPLNEAIYAYQTEYNEKYKEYEEVVKISQELADIVTKLKQKRSEINKLLVEKNVIEQEKQQSKNNEIASEYDHKILSVK